MLKSFRRGGVFPPGNKLSEAAKVEVMPLPEIVVIPLSQHIGAPAEAIVSKGDRVKVGQLIAKASGFVSSNIHSSVSGEVVAVGNTTDLSGAKRPSVTIKVEGDEWEESIDRREDLVSECSLNPKEIIEKVFEAGIVGMGGATFPAQIKLMVPDDKKIDFLIINGAECEPYLTSDHRVMLEKADEVLVGARILGKALGAEQIFIGIEDNKKDAIELFVKKAEKYKEIKITPLGVKYPQGAEKQMIAAVTKREVPSGKLPMDVGVVVQNVSTSLAVYNAVQKNKPLVERVVTVTGKTIKNKVNLLTRIGVPISELIEYSGGLPENSGKIIVGGPMMGKATANLEVPVTKGTSAILVLPEGEAKRREQNVCIKCAKCIEACPMGLEPYLLYKLSKQNLFDRVERGRATDCMECGSCSFTCPAALPLLDYIRLGKSEAIQIARMRQS